MPARKTTKPEDTAETAVEDTQQATQEPQEPAGSQDEAPAPSQEQQASQSVPRPAYASETSGRIQDTTTDNLLADSDLPQEATGDEAFMVLKLATFLREQFPAQYHKTNRPAREHPVDMAIRLLQGFTTESVGVVHCDQAYCNKAAGHTGEHGWVVYDPSPAFR